MARLAYGMNQSLDGYVDHDKFGPGPVLFQHFVEQTRGLAGSIYGRRMYEIMRYFDDEQPGWGDAERAFAAAWCGQHKWVVSSTLTEVGPNATLVTTGLEPLARKLKAELDGDIDVAGTRLAQGLTDLGLIDVYRIYLHPVVVGDGTPFFRGPRPPLRLVESEEIDGVMKLIYVPA